MLSGFVTSVNRFLFFFLFSILLSSILFPPLYYSNGFRHTYTLPYLIAGLSEYMDDGCLGILLHVLFFSNFPCVCYDYYESSLCVVLLPNDAYYVFQSIIVPNKNYVQLCRNVEALAQGLPRDRVARVGPKPVGGSVQTKTDGQPLDIFRSSPRLSRRSRSALSFAASLLHSAQSFLH